MTCLDATSIYKNSLVYALREDGGLGQFQRKIHILDPKQVRKFKEAYPDLPKNDWVDAFVIADHPRFGSIWTTIATRHSEHLPEPDLMSFRT